MKICVIGNFSDTQCGFASFSEQTVTALRRAGHEVVPQDDTYPLVYARREAGQESFLPPDAAAFDVIHVVWHPAKLNHVSGAVWPTGLVLSVWNGCPAAWCPFIDQMRQSGSPVVQWGVLGREEGHLPLWYPIPDWVDDLPAPDPVYTVGWTGVRGEGLPALERVCADEGWALNVKPPDIWLPIDDEVRRLARSTVNVGWMGDWDDRAGSVMTALGSRRPLLVNHSTMFLTLEGAEDIYRGDDLRDSLRDLYRHWQEGDLRLPEASIRRWGWRRAVDVLEAGWLAAKER